MGFTDLKQSILAHAAKELADHGEVRGTTVFAAGAQDFILIRFLPNFSEARELLEALAIIFCSRRVTEFSMVFSGSIGDPDTEPSYLVVHKTTGRGVAEISQLTHGFEDGHGCLREVLHDTLCDGDLLDLLRPAKGSLEDAEATIEKCRENHTQYIINGI